MPRHNKGSAKYISDERREPRADEIAVMVITAHDKQTYHQVGTTEYTRPKREPISVSLHNAYVKAEREWPGHVLYQGEHLLKQ